jgi:hypothetical protein
MEMKKCEKKIEPYTFLIKGENLITKSLFFLENII